MASARTVKTLGYLMAAMTAVTLVLSFVEPWTVSLRPRTAVAHASEGLPALASVTPTGAWQKIELVVAGQSPSTGRATAHLVVHADGRFETTDLWRQGQPLTDGVLRVIAVSRGTPTDTQLRRWLTACEQAGEHFNLPADRLRLRLAASADRSLRGDGLKDLQRRLGQMLRQRQTD